MDGILARRNKPFLFVWSAAQRRRHEKNKNQHRCPADSCAVHTAKQIELLASSQGSEIICCRRSGIEGVGWKVRIAWLAGGWFMRGAWLTDQHIFFVFLKRKRNDNEGFDDVYVLDGGIGTIGPIRAQPTSQSRLWDLWPTSWMAHSSRSCWSNDPNRLL